MLYLGLYAGTVEAVNDPEQIGRLKVRVPAVYGPAGAKENSIPTDGLPWAYPGGLPAGGTEESGAVVWLPSIGDHVDVQFYDGQPEKPRWSWGMQDVSQAAETSFWKQEGGYEGGKAPSASYLTRYGHRIVLYKERMVIVTKKGYSIELSDKDDSATITAPTVTVVAETLCEVQAPKIQLGTGADDPVVRLSDLKAAVDSVVAQFNAHTHPKTAVPTKPMTVTPAGSEVSFSK